MADEDEPAIDFTRDLSRREMMQVGGGLSVFGIAAMSGCTFFEENGDVTPQDEMEEVEIEAQGLEYFTIEEARVVHDLTGRIYPSDDNGPGAPEAGVVYFIDRQMNSAWGRGERWYMEPPFAGHDPTVQFQTDPQEPGDQGGGPDSGGEGGPEEPAGQDGDETVNWGETTPAQTQGWQSPLTPNEVYDQAIPAIEDYTRAEFDANSFVELSDARQDQVVLALQNDEVGTFQDLAIDASGFFSLLRENTLEGMFSDPMYGGNREMIGWRLKGFPGTPGALGSYRDVIQQEEFIELEPGDYRKLADDVAALGLGEETETPTEDDGPGQPDVQPLERMEDVDPSKQGHSHAHEAAEADYPRVVDEDAARGNADAGGDADVDADADGGGDA